MAVKKPKLTQKQKFKLLEQNSDAFEKYRLNFVKAQLRRASVWKWPAASIALDRNKLDGMVKCDGCGKYFSEKQINRDHIIPVEDVKDGFTTLDNYAKRLLVKSDEIQILCEKTCHANKTLIENEMRRKYGQKPIKIKSKKKKLTIIKKKVKIRK